MLCISPMLSLLKLQQKTTLHTSHFINACSAEKKQQRTSLQLTVNRSHRTKTSQNCQLEPLTHKHSFVQDQTQHAHGQFTKTLSNQLDVPCLCNFPCSKASLKRTAITTRNRITCTAHKNNPVGTSMDDGDNHIESD